MLARLPLRARLAALFAAGFALLLAAGSAGLYAWLAASYRRDFDEELEATGRAARLLFDQDLPEYGSTRATLQHILAELVFGDRTIVAFDPGGIPVARSAPYPGQVALAGLDLGRAPTAPATVRVGDERVRLLRVPMPDGHQLVVAHALAPLDQRLRELRLALLLGVPLVLVAGGVVGAASARSVLAPIVATAELADRVGAQVAAGATEVSRLREPVADDELAVLTRAFNRLVERLTRALAAERAAADRQRRFLADAAHELRTPVAILQSDAESALAAPGDAPAPLRGALRRVADEAARLGRLVGDLLTLARDGDAPHGATLQRVFLDDVAGDVVARARRLPAAGGRELRLGEFDEAPALADAALAERAILSLVENALLHAPGSPVEVSAGTTAAPSPMAWVAVRDWGPGVPDDAREAVFERFARLDPSRPGTGLGLAIARHVAQSLGGDVTLDAPPGGGARFTFQLPAVRAGQGTA